LNKNLTNSIVPPIDLVSAMAGQFSDQEIALFLYFNGSQFVAGDRILHFSFNSKTKEKIVLLLDRRGQLIESGRFELHKKRWSYDVTIQWSWLQNNKEFVFRSSLTAALSKYYYLETGKKVFTNSLALCQPLLREPSL